MKENESNILDEIDIEKYQEEMQENEKKLQSIKETV
jgi:hypothetical protein